MSLGLKKKFLIKYGWPVIIILAAGILRLPLLSLPLSVHGTDSWRQADTASIARHFYLNGYHLLYPQIYWGGNGPGFVETEFQLYTFIVSLLYGLFGEQVWLGRLVSFVLSLLTFVFFYLLAKWVLPEERSATWALAFFVFSPLFIRYSVAFMPEAMVMLFYIAALFLFYRWTRNLQTRLLLISSICLALAILVKPTSIHIGLVLALLAMERLGLSVLKRWDVWFALLVSLLPALFWYWHARNLYLEYGNTFGLFSGGDSKFGNLAVWLSPSFYVALAKLELKWVFAVGALIPFIIGLLFCFRNKGNWFAIYGIITVGIYYMIVARYARQEWGIQYHVYMLPYAALCVGLGMDWLTRWLRQTPKLAMALVSAAFFLYASMTFYSEMLTPPQDLLAQCAAYVQAVVPPGELIVVSTTSVAMDHGVPNNYQDPQIFFYSRRYGWSLPADWHNAEKLIELRKAGADYFVIYSKELLDANPSLADYLKSYSEQIGPGIDSGCAIYQFNQLGVLTVGKGYEK